MYIVTDSNWDEKRILGVYSTRELAFGAAERFRGRDGRLGLLEVTHMVLDRDYDEEPEPEPEGGLV
jgi:hypothetical protein